MRPWWLLVLLVLASCTGIAPEQLEPPEVRLVDLVPAGFGLFEQKLEARLRILNPNTVALTARGLRFDLETEGSHLGRGVGNARFTVPALGEKEITVPLHVSTATLVEHVLELARGQGITYRLKGDILLSGGIGGTTALPFESEAALRLPRLPGAS